MSIELELDFSDNAFKHGISEEEIWGVFLNQEVKCLILKYKKDARDTIYNAYGIALGGKYLEIGFIKKASSKYRVIHAMEMRDSSKRRFKKIRKLS